MGVLSLAVIISVSKCLLFHTKKVNAYNVDLVRITSAIPETWIASQLFRNKMTESN